MTKEPEVSPARSTPSTRGRVAMAVGAAAVVLAGLAGWLGSGSSRSDEEPRPVRRFSVNLPPELPLHHFLPGISSRNLAVSPDGTILVYRTYRTTSGGGAELTSLARRDLAGLEVEVMPGTEAATEPAFSPDGTEVVFWVPGEGVKKIELVGGRPQALYSSGRVLMPGGLSWSEDGFIYLAPAEIGGVGLMNQLIRVPETGGAAEILYPTDGPSEELFVGNPEPLPGGRALLLTVFTGLGLENSTVEVLDLETGERRALVEQASAAQFVGDRSSQRGHIVYAQVGRLMANPFDLGRLEVTGPAVDVTEASMRLIEDPAPRRWTVARNGALIFAPGGQRFIVLVDRSGAREVLSAAPTPHSLEPWPVISPDGHRIAIHSMDEEIWVYDLERQSSFRVTSSPSMDMRPFWSLDGEHLLFASVRDSGTRDLFRKRADGTGRAEKLAAGPYYINATELTDEGSAVLFSEWGDPETSNNIGLLRLDGTGSVERLLWTDSSEWGPTLSPDGRSLAYNSDESGQQEVYVLSFPSLEGRTMLSRNGGQFPRWHPSGKEIFFWNDGGIFAVEIETDGGFSGSLPRNLFTGSYAKSYSVFSDGDRFAMVDETTGDHELVVVENWSRELERLAPTGD